MATTYSSKAKIVWTILILFSALLFIYPNSLQANVKSKVPVKYYKNDYCIKLNIAISSDGTCYEAQGYIFAAKKKKLQSFFMDPVNFIKEKVKEKSAKKIKVSNEDYLFKFSFVEIVEGEICIVSGLILDPKKDIVIEYGGGRRLPFKKEALPIILSNPGKYFAKKQPRGALWTESTLKSPRLSLNWLIFGIYVLVGLIFAALTTQRAFKKNLSLILWFFAGLFLNVIAYIAVLMIKKTDDPYANVDESKIYKTTSPKICPSCEMENHPSLNVCHECGKPLNKNIKQNTIPNTP